MLNRFIEPVLPFSFRQLLLDRVRLPLVNFCTRHAFFFFFFDSLVYSARIIVVNSQHPILPFTNHDHDIKVFPNYFLNWKRANAQLSDLQNQKNK